MGKLNDLLVLAEREVGYTEKNNDNDLYSKVGATAGSGNHTKYADYIKKNYGLEAYCGQAWCATYQFYLETQVYGLQQALRNFGNAFYNCFSIMNYAKAKTGDSRWISRTGTPVVGCRVIFKQSHIALVTKVTSTMIYTNEGNTNNGTAVVRNGGMVCNKSYSRNNSSILGYVIMKHDEQPVVTEKFGWSKENNGYRYYLGTSDKYVKNDWLQDKDSIWYYFDENGMMKENTWIYVKDKWYWLNPGGAMVANDWTQQKGIWYWLTKSGAMLSNSWLEFKNKWYYLNDSGAMLTNTWYMYKEDWYYLDKDGIMVTGLLEDDGKYYVFDDDGKMITEPVVLTPDMNGALKYTGLANN